MAIFSTLVDAAETNIYVADGDKMISTTIFCNTETPDPYHPDNNIIYLDLWLVKNGDTLGTKHKIVNALPIPAGETVFFDTERIVLQLGDRLVGEVVSGGSDMLACTVSVVDI